jgi:hypothetical protein
MIEAAFQEFRPRTIPRGSAHFNKGWILLIVNPQDLEAGLGKLKLQPARRLIGPACRIQ